MEEYKNKSQKEYTMKRNFTKHLGYILDMAKAKDRGKCVYLAITRCSF
jgi:hypothetical protein